MRRVLWILFLYALSAFFNVSPSLSGPFGHPGKLPYAFLLSSDSSVVLIA